MSKHRIVIDIDEEGKSVTIQTDEGERFFESVAVFAGDALNNERLIKMYGASADAAWAAGQAFIVAQSPEGGPGLKNFFKQLAARICFAIDPMSFRQEVGADEVLNKWKDEDQSHWFAQDSEDVLEDKARAERSKARAEKLGIKVLGPEAIVSDDTDDSGGGSTYH